MTGTPPQQVAEPEQSKAGFPVFQLLFVLAMLSCFVGAFWSAAHG